MQALRSLSALVAKASAAVRTGELELLVARLEALTGQGEPAPLADRMTRAVGAVEEGFASAARRLNQRHAITGLPTREPLLARIVEDGRGLLGAVAFDDYDRLCAFDPALGERALLAVVDRMTRMLPDDRLIAQVDRAHFAIWFGPAVSRSAAEIELGAIGYALGDVIAGPSGDILPEIRVRRARFPDDGDNPQALLARTLASFAHHGAEQAGTAAIVDTAGAARERYLMEQGLRRAAERGELALCFQPLIDAGEARVSGAEALIRWQHPTWGQVPPSRFVPLAEAIGMAHELGMWALNAATREAREWQRQELKGLRVAVNVSGHQLERTDLVTLVERALARHSLRPDALEIELTESVAMGDSDRAAQLFRALRALDVKIAIDDFGTGYSSFSTLRSLVFDKIKIDREFVTLVDARRDSQAICQSIIALGRGLGIRVLAEGVERREEYEWLRRHGCTHFQGYYFAPPLGGAAFAAFVRDTDHLAGLLTPNPADALDRNLERLTA